MISGYELLALNTKMDDLVETLNDYEVYLAYISPVGEEREYINQKMTDIHIDIEETLEAIENCGGTYEFD